MKIVIPEKILPESLDQLRATAAAHKMLELGQDRVN
jgi:hypothetical protein